MLGILMACIVPADGLFADEYAGKVTTVLGKVTVRMPGWDKITTLKAGDRVPVGGDLKTEKDAKAQLIFTDGSFIRVLPGSTLRINQYAYTPTDRRSSAIIKMIDGRARFVVFDRQRSGDSRFTVETEHATMGAGIADFFVTASPAETEVAVIGSSLSVRNISPLAVGNVNLGVNHRTVVKERTPPTRPATIPAEQRKKYVQDTAF